jgi:hypothetical protein
MFEPLFQRGEIRAYITFRAFFSLVAFHEPSTTMSIILISGAKPVKTQSSSMKSGREKG